MRKICLLLCFLFLVTIMFPFSVHATEAPLTYDELIELSCEVFPEYADRITNPVISSSSTYSTRDPVIISEVRTISDNEVLTYQEMASGYSILSYSHKWDVISSSDNGYQFTKTGSLYVYCSISPEVFALTEFTYKINTSGYDYISDFGETYLSSCTVMHSESSSNYRKQFENGSGPAYAVYNLTFNPLDYSAFVPVSCLVSLDVGNNVLVVTVGDSSRTYS